LDNIASFDQLYLLSRDRDCWASESNALTTRQHKSGLSLFSENLDKQSFNFVFQTNTSDLAAKGSSSITPKEICKGSKKALYQQKRINELAQTAQSLRMKQPTNRNLICSDGVTRIPYEVLGGEAVALESGHVNFVVCYDIFDYMDITRLIFLDVLKKHRGCRILIFNQPGQAGTTFPRQSSTLSGKEEEGGVASNKRK